MSLQSLQQTPTHRTTHVVAKSVERNSSSKNNVFHIYKLKRGRKYKHRVKSSNTNTRRRLLISTPERNVAVIRANSAHLQCARLYSNESIHLPPKIIRWKDPVEELLDATELQNEKMFQEYMKSAKVDTTNDVMPIRVNPERIYRRLLGNKFVKQPSLED